MIPFRYKGASHCKLIFDDVSVILKFLISDGTIVLNRYLRDHGIDGGIKFKKSFTTFVKGSNFL